MAKFNSGDILKILRKFQIAGEENVPRNVEELKKIADFVTKDADDGGIEHACRHFGWID